MRPLENHLELSSHIWMYSRLKELLVREGLIGPGATDDEIREAVAGWVVWVAEVSHDGDCLIH